MLACSGTFATLDERSDAASGARAMGGFDGSGSTTFDGSGSTTFDGSGSTTVDGGRGGISGDSGANLSAAPVAASSCSSADAACVAGGILSTGRAPADTAAEVLPAGTVVTDDGFELGGSSCDSTGMTCVTGGITP
jgi:hypothetical protein